MKEFLKACINDNVYIISILLVKDLSEFIYSIFIATSTTGLVNYNNASNTISLILLLAMFFNIFNQKKQIKDTMLLATFADIRHTVKIAKFNRGGLPMFTDDLEIEKNTILKRMIDKPQIKNVVTEEKLKEFIDRQYEKYYKDAGFKAGQNLLK